MAIPIDTSMKRRRATIHGALPWVISRTMLRGDGGDVSAAFIKDKRVMARGVIQVAMVEFYS